jgi:hypothetical protein
LIPLPVFEKDSSGPTFRARHIQGPSNHLSNSPKPSDSAKLSFEIYVGFWLRFVGKTIEEPSRSV